MRGGWWLGALLLLLFGNLLLLFFALPAQLVLADCDPYVDPWCLSCGVDGCQPGNGENCDTCLIDCPCGTGESCQSGSCVQTGCNNDGTCQTSVENWVNCPSDCDPPCIPDCSGRECGDDGCSGYCGPYYDDCPGGDACVNGQCCDPTCPSGAGWSCTQYYTGLENDCGQSCPNVWGDTCSGGLYCKASTHSCEECLYSWHCPSDTTCKNWGCSGGDCSWQPTYASCTPPGYPAGSGTCDANGDCVWDGCSPPMADCDGSPSSCETNTNTDPDHCGSCNSPCDWDQECDTGACVCAFNPLSDACPQLGCGQHEVCGATVDCGDCASCEDDNDCSDGKSCCDGGCVDTTSNANHCGACAASGGEVCAGETPRCENNNCVCSADPDSCGAGETCTGGSCSCDYTSANDYCDAFALLCGTHSCGDGRQFNCEQFCDGGRDCSSGSCQCPEGEEWNGEECVATDCAATCDHTCCNENCCGADQVCHATTGDCCTRNANECGSDGCGDEHPECGGDLVCEGGICTDPSCPDDRTDAQVCAAAGASCGSVLDGCGDSRSCGGCADGFSCSGNTCVPVGCADSCASLGFQCGFQSVCGERVDCGGCDDGDACTSDACHSLPGGGSSCSHVAVDPVCPPAGETPCATTPEPINDCGDCAHVVGTQCPDAPPADGDGWWCAATCLACVDDPASGNYDCGEEVRRCSDGAIVRGRNCSPYESCDTSTWSCVPSEYAITQEDLWVRAGRTAVLAPVLTPDDPHSWAYDGWMTARIRETSHADVGEHSVSITALDFSGDELKTRTISVNVECDPANRRYGPCCDPDDTLTLRTNGFCQLHGSTDPNAGVCNAQGECVEYCEPNHHQGCFDDRLYHYDSCGDQGDLIADCTLDGEVCLEDPPRCAEAPAACDLAPRYECRGQQGVLIDECGLVHQERLCSDYEECVATSQGIDCLAADCAYDELECQDECVDPMSDRQNCGQCSNQCANDEQCEDGQCTPIAGCIVICDSNADCGEGEVCLHPGDCTESQCEPINVLEQEPEALHPLVSELLRTELLLINTSLGDDTFTFTLANLAPLPLRNVSFVADFAKTIAQHADHLTVEGTAYEVLDPDPVLKFSTPLLEDERQFTVAASHALSPDYLQHVAITDITYTAMTEAELLAAWNETNDALTIGLNSEYDGERTKFHLSLNPSKDLQGLTVPLEIPKCLAEYASQLSLEGDYRIIKEDPLIAWKFDTLNEPTEITFSVPKDIDEECKQQLKALAFARRVGKPLNPLLGLLLIPVIAVLIVFLQRFEGRGGERLSKRDFFEAGRAGGESDEDIERSWRDYKRRF